MEAETVEHRQALERTTRYQRDRIAGMVPYTVGRYVCTCGHTTKWWRNPKSAQRARDDHALDGQLSFRV